MGHVRSPGLFGRVALLAACALITAPAASAATTLTGSAFEIDGDTTGALGTDWSAPGSLTVASASDPKSGTPDTSVFGPNITEAEPAPSVGNGTISRPYDLTSFRTTSQTVHAGGANHTYVFFAWEREAGGQALVDVELRQGSGRRVGDQIGRAHV